MLSKIDHNEFLFEKDLPDPNNFDVIVLAVSHSQYKEINFASWLERFKGLFIDSNNVLSNNQISNLKKLNLKLRIIGRGDI